MATGEFTAPKSGIYSFSWAGLPKQNTIVRILLMKNDQEVANTYASAGMNNAAFAGTQVHLKDGLQEREKASKFGNWLVQMYLRHFW